MGCPLVEDKRLEDAAAVCASCPKTNKVNELSVWGQKMVEMDHFMNLDFPISRDDFPMIDWQLYRVWKILIQDEVQIREQLRHDENESRRKAGLKPLPREMF